MRKSSNLNQYRDGQTRIAAVAPVPRLHDGLEFRYRPLLGEKAERLQTQVQEPKAEEGYKRICRALAEHITEWSESAPPNYENMRHMPYKIILDSYRILLGLQPSDEIESESEDAQRVDEEFNEDTPEAELKK